ncbi:MAG: NAD(P)H-dependent glycerol-3-phosphate dehydrogenase [bacterium]|nr:NAD(P)H-dependent glycerol-3-phosphate dehydrogenase [bacterium]
MRKSPEVITILGAGALGTALAVLISDFKKARVRLWDKDQGVINRIKESGKNPKYLPENIKIGKEIELFTDPQKAVKDSDSILLAVPSFAIRDVCQKIHPGPEASILTTSKGLEEETGFFPSEIVENSLKNNNILHLSWVGFVKEIYRSIPAKVVLASKKQKLLEEFGNIFNFKARGYQFSTSQDLTGTQLAGALKNVMAIGIGITGGLKENAEIKKTLIRKGIEEMIVLGKALGAEKKTFLGPAGMKDLEISSSSQSRNYSYGKAIFEKGVARVRQELKKRNITVEGFHTASAIQRIMEKYNLSLPLIQEVYRVVHAGKDPKIAAQRLIRLTL